MNLEQIKTQIKDFIDNSGEDVDDWDIDSAAWAIREVLNVNDETYISSDLMNETLETYKY